MADTAAPPASGKGNVLTRKIGPLPTWAWVGIVIVPIGIYAYIERKKSAAASNTTTGTDTTGASDMTDASQVPQFVNQTYTTVIPPTAPGSLPVTTPPSGGTSTTAPPTVPPGTPGPGAPPPAPGNSGPVGTAPGVASGLYWHSSPGGGKSPYFTLNGRSAP